MRILNIILFILPFINGLSQAKYSLSISGGFSSLFEAKVANESSGTFLGLGLERKVGKFSIFASFEKISCQNGARNGINQFSFNGGPWMISDYKGYINLERRDWAFDDVVVDERLFSAGNWNYPGNEQTFDSNNLILGIGYELYRKKIFSISANIGLATSLIHVSAVNLGYTTDLNKSGRQFLVEIPTYLKYLYFSSYISMPFEFDISKNLGISIVGSLYRATELYIPSLGIKLQTQL
ncbi:MAG: hypothetical protein R2774_07650 [Saprospiraceae bacterium]